VDEQRQTEDEMKMGMKMGHNEQFKHLAGTKTKTKRWRNEGERRGEQQVEQGCKDVRVKP
jgi:hypothetical protein